MILVYFVNRLIIYRQLNLIVKMKFKKKILFYFKGSSIDDCKDSFKRISLLINNESIIKKII